MNVVSRGWQRMGLALFLGRFNKSFTRIRLLRGKKSGDYSRYCRASQPRVLVNQTFVVDGYREVFIINILASGGDEGVQLLNDDLVSICDGRQQLVQQRSDQEKLVCKSSVVMQRYKQDIINDF